MSLQRSLLSRCVRLKWSCLSPWGCCLVGDRTGCRAAPPPKTLGDSQPWRTRQVGAGLGEALGGAGVRCIAVQRPAPWVPGDCRPVRSARLLRTPLAPCFVPQSRDKGPAGKAEPGSSSCLGDQGATRNQKAQLAAPPFHSPLARLGGTAAWQSLEAQETTGTARQTEAGGKLLAAGRECHWEVGGCPSRAQAQAQESTPSPHSAPLAV